jgi:hypothetical protein
MQDKQSHKDALIDPQTPDGIVHDPNVAPEV